MLKCAQSFMFNKPEAFTVAIAADYTQANNKTQTVKTVAVKVFEAVDGD